MTRNTEVVIEILRNEVRGDISSSLKKMAENYSMTWMYKGQSGIFPQITNDIKSELQKVYCIKGRKYDIKNIAEGENVVMIELVESYPDPKSGKIFQTPLVLVLEIKDGKIETGRHYCDPQISKEDLDREVLAKAYKNTTTKLLIKYHNRD